MRKKAPVRRGFFHCGVGDCRAGFQVPKVCCFTQSPSGISSYLYRMSDKMVALFSIFLGAGLVIAALLLLAAVLL
jgi:hypothetical protein